MDNVVEEGTISVEDEVIINEDKEELMKLLNTLESIDKEIFILKFFLGVKSEDIAKRLGVTKASIDNRIYRAKKKLRGRKSMMNMEVK